MLIALILPIGFHYVLGIIVVSCALSVVSRIRLLRLYRRYHKMATTSGIPGAQVARRILDATGLSAVPIEMTPGALSDHYDPRRQVVRLSQSVYQGSSLAAAASAAKVASMAAQHKERLPLVTWRLALTPMMSIAGMLWTPLALLALILVQPLLIDLAIYLAGVILVYEVVVILSLRDADRRAVVQLQQLKAVSDDQIPKVRELLDAASKTYVASALTGGLASIILLLCRIRFEENR
jgi:hypothetical protein